MNNQRLWLFLHSKWWLAVLLFFWWYFYHLAPDYLVTWGASSDFARLASTGGNFITPQFNILLALLRVVTHLLPLPAFQTSYFLASFIAGATLSLVYVFLTLFDRFMRGDDARLAFLLKNALLFYLASNLTFLRHSVFFERYMITLLLFFGFILTLHTSIRAPKKPLFAVGFVILVCGISLHWLFVLSGLVFILTVPRFKLGWLTGYLFAVMTALLVAHLLTTPVTMQSFVGPRNLLDTVNFYRERYLTDGFELSLPRDLLSIQTWLKLAFRHLAETVNLIVLLLAVVGWWRLSLASWKVSRASLIVLLGLITQRLMFFRSDSVDVAYFLELSSLFLVVFFGVLAFYGSYFMLSRLYLGLAHLHSPASAGIIMTLAGGVFMVGCVAYGTTQFRFPLNPVEVNRSILVKLPTDSLLFCFEQIACADLLYLSQVERVRTDIRIVPYYYDPGVYQATLEDLRPFGYQTKPQVLHEILSVALNKNPGRVFATGVSQNYYAYLGFDLGLIYYLPLGNYGELTLKLPKTPTQAPVLGEAEVGLFNHTSGLLDGYALHLIQNRLLSATTYFQMGLYDYGYQEMNAASNMANTLAPIHFREFLANRNNVEQLVRSPLYRESDPLFKVPQLLKAIPHLIEAKLYVKAVAYARGCLLLDPFNVSLRQQIAGFYEQMGMTSMANTERAIIQQLSAHEPTL